MYRHLELRMETLCSTCLSRNRRVTSINNIINGENFWEYLDISIQKYVCWECKAMFKKLSKFKKQVVTAQHVLRNKIVSKFNLSHLQVYNQTHVISLKERNFEIESIPIIDPFDIKDENDLMVCELEPMNNIQNEDYVNSIPVIEHKEVENKIPVVENNDFDHLIPVIECKEVNKHKENYIKPMENKDYDNLIPVECKEINKQKELKEPIETISNLKGKILREVIMGQTLKIISNLFDKSGSVEVELFLTPYEQKMERFYIRLLTDLEMLNLREDRKSRAPYKACKFKCDMCILQYYSEDKYKHHCSNYHVKKKGYILCNICKCYISDKDTHRDHFVRHYVVYQCKECGYEEQNHIALTKHHRIVHEVAVYSCQHCEQEFLSESKMRQHVERHHIIIAPCTLCDKTFTTRSGRVKHMRNHNGVTKLKCETCGKEYKGMESLRAHQRVHNPALANENAYCAECDRQFKNIYQYNRHLKVNEKHRPPGDLRYKCMECSKQFLIESALKMHMLAVHKNEREFVCSICDKGFIRRNRLKEHIMHKHEGVPRSRKYPCTYCDKVFTWRAILTNHVRTHTGEKPFECNVCHRKFNQRASLRTHLLGVHKMSRADAAVSILTGDESV